MARLQTSLSGGLVVVAQRDGRTDYKKDMSATLKYKAGEPHPDCLWGVQVQGRKQPASFQRRPPRELGCTRSMTGGLPSVSYTVRHGRQSV